MLYSGHYDKFIGMYKYTLSHYYGYNNHNNFVAGIPQPGHGVMTLFSFIG